MKRQIITYILAAFCAAAVFSCNKETTIDNVGPDSEFTVLLTASIDASTKAVSFDRNELVCSWAVGETVDLVFRDTVISKLEVISVDGDKAQLSGKVRGGYRENDEMKLFYGVPSENYVYDYSNQTGTDSSAVSKAFLQAKTKVKSLVDKTLTLESATLEHRQAYMGLFFYYEDKPVDVKSVAIKEGGDYIIKTRKPLSQTTDSLTTYKELTDEKFTVTSEKEYGQPVFFFALSDTTTTIVDHKYKLEITTITPPAPNQTKPDTTVYYGRVAAPGLSGNYFADFRVNLVRRSPVITAPTVYSHIYYDGLPHNLITPAEVRHGTTAYYAVSAIPDEVPSEWNPTVPKRTNEGSYTVWYKVEGGNDYESILPTIVGTAVIRTVDYTTIVLPTPINSTYNAVGHSLLNTNGSVIVPGSAPLDHNSLEYYVKLKNGDTIPEAPTGEETTGWSSSIPQGTNAGDYYIWCRYRGNGGSNLPAFAGPVIAHIAKAAATVTANNQNVSLNGTIVTNESAATFNGGVVGTHYLFSVTLSTEVTSAQAGSGPITPVESSIVIKDSNTGDIVTGNYSFTCNPGIVTVSGS